MTVLRNITRSLTLMIVVAAVACGEDPLPKGDRPAAPPIERDLDLIAGGKTLTALMTWNSTGYFVYRGEPMGFEYDLLKRFAKAHDLELDVVVVRDRERLWDRLNRGEGDVVAARLLKTVVDERDVAFTRPLYDTRPTLVQREGPPSSVELPEAAERILETQRTVEVRAKLIPNPSALAGREVHIPRRHPFEERLVELSTELSDDIQVVEVENVASIEPLVRRVSRGEIRLTVAPENVAELKEEYFTNIAVTPAIGPPMDVVWAVRKNAPNLLREIDEWLDENEDVVDELYAKYFEEREGFRERIESEYLTSETGRLSEYDELFREAAPKIGWDWRLLASQAFQESKFKPRAKSWAGAQGLLQLMPGTAREVGVRQVYDPKQNVAGAVRYLAKLQKKWSGIADPDERLKFILASYNAGAGHVEDARRLTKKNGGDPDKWEDVSWWLLQKSKRKVYNDPVVKYGFVRGLEPVTYVSLILERYEHYRQFVQPDEAAA